MILLVGGEKGGTGKSTIATNIAVVLAAQGVDVVLVDADKQATAARWKERRDATGEELPRVHCIQRNGSLFETLQDLAGRYDEVIVDAGGQDSKELRTAMAIANKFYIPLRPSQPDIETSVHVDELVDQAKAFNPSLDALALISMAPTHHAVNEANEAEELLNELPSLKLSGVMVRHRKVYRDAMAEGRGVIEMRNPKATASINALVKEIYG